jgi:hypothetical protein
MRTVFSLSTIAAVVIVGANFWFGRAEHGRSASGIVAPTEIAIIPERWEYLDSLEALRNVGDVSDEEFDKRSGDVLETYLKWDAKAFPGEPPPTEEMCSLILELTALKPHRRNPNSVAHMIGAHWFDGVEDLGMHDGTEPFVTDGTPPAVGKDAQAALAK